MTECDTLPEISESEKKVGVPSRINPSTLEALKRIAVSGRRTVSDTIRVALEDFAKANDPDDKPRRLPKASR